MHVGEMNVCQNFSVGVCMLICVKSNVNAISLDVIFKCVHCVFKTFECMCVSLKCVYI